MIAVAIGSNIEPEKHIALALERLARRVRVTALSNFYRTAAVGPAGQPPFVNGACALCTDLGPLALKREVLRTVEFEGGRRRGDDKYAPRTIDLDLLVHGDFVLQSAELALPDPEILHRPFLWVPLLELDPELVLPGMQSRLDVLTRGSERGSMELDAALTAKFQRCIDRGALDADAHT